MNKLKRTIRWCPQPTRPIPINSMRLPSLVIAGTLLVEIVALLIAPAAYYALVPPKTDYGIMQTIPLTDSQIAASWPNLPTADQIVKSGVVYLTAGPGMNSSIKNCTMLNVPDWHNGGLIPVSYHIWLQYNGAWIAVPNAYLATNNPPQLSMGSGFLGTNLPIAYVVAAVVVMAVTIAASISYLLLAKWKKSKT